MTETGQQPQGVPAAAEESKKKWRWPAFLLGGSAAVLIFAIAMPSDTDADAGASGGTAVSVPANDVPWEDYAPEVRQRIDDLGSTGDCAALQAEFDVADANNDATMARAGHNTPDLMSYVDGWMQQAGCYS